VCLLIAQQVIVLAGYLLLGLPGVWYARHFLSEYIEPTSQDIGMLGQGVVRGACPVCEVEQHQGNGVGCGEICNGIGS